MKRLIILLYFLAAPLFLIAQSSAPMTIKLWPDGAPDSNGLTGPETELGDGRIGNISDPELIVFPAQNPNGKAIIMCPGGDYFYVSAGHEGIDMAGWFNSLGITFAVLKYRMPNSFCDIPLEDAHRAITLMRKHSQEWNFTQLGIMGCSAGGHIACCASEHFTKTTRPDFQILLYPLISYIDRVTPGGKNILFDMYPSDEQVEYYSCELNVTPDCPPAFIVHCEDDPTILVSESEGYYDALIQNGVPAVFIKYPEGGHGWGFNDGFKFKAEWTSELEKWLNDL